MCVCVGWIGYCYVVFIGTMLIGVVHLGSLMRCFSLIDNVICIFDCVVRSSMMWYHLLQVRVVVFSTLEKSVPFY